MIPSPKNFSKKLVLFAIALLLFSCSQNRDLQLPKLFGDYMVLQRDKPIKIWGWANPGETVSVEFAGQQQTATVSPDGEWAIEFPAKSSGGPFTLDVSTARQTLRFEDILIGEVWVCSGQSNMNMPLASWGRITNFEQEIREANYPEIRLFTVEKAMAATPQSDVQSDGWSSCSPETIAEFSAVAYFFGRNIFRETNVPVGLIHSSWGGTNVEAWMSESALTDVANLSEDITDVKKSTPQADEKILQTYKNDLKFWYENTLKNDAGFQNDTAFAQPGFDDSGWKTMHLPRLWDRVGYESFDGVIWFRKSITIPKMPENSGDWTLNLDTIDDFDITFVNGKKAGEHLKRNHPTRYSVPANWLHPGENTIAVRVLDVGSRGGIWGAADQLYFASPANDTIPLAGEWRFKIALDNAENPAPKRPYLHKRPTVLFNAMVAPLTKFPVRGVIWYQGESNISQAFSYRELFRNCIRDWRTKWDDPALPFYFAQIANFYQPDPQPFESKWAELREAQQMALNLPNTGMAVTIDIGNPDDIHPKNKQEVGRRLALIALNKNYQQSVPFSGPLYRGNTVENGAIFIEFDFADGLRANGDWLTGFAIAGSDKHFKPAKAAIAGNRVKVWHPAIADPVAVRYGWASSPDCNLINNSNLPASPFRTDNWDGITKKQN